VSPNRSITLSKRNELGDADNVGIVDFYDIISEISKCRIRCINFFH